MSLTSSIAEGIKSISGSISEAVVKTISKNVNSEISEIDDTYYSIKGINDFAGEIEELTTLWNTAGGKQNVQQTTNKAKELETNKLTNSISALSKERTSYTIKTVTDSTTKTKITE